MPPRLNFIVSRPLWISRASVIKAISKRISTNKNEILNLGFCITSQRRSHKVLPTTI
jgi:hypothetical protein